MQIFSCKDKTCVNKQKRVLQIQTLSISYMKILYTTDVIPECKLIRGGGALVNLLGLFKEL